VCDICRNGYQFGWDCTSSFDELTTDLGFFDEGSSEVADWETKWLCEHGIDFKLVCWYGGVANAAAPLKLPRNSAGINAYMNSKYSDMVKYAIMYENSGNIPQNIPDFRNNILAYWLEYYLSDKDRYYTIDNKALITIYRPTTFLELCGNDKQVMRSELDNIRNECRKLGYDGAIILTVSSSDIETAYSCGFDGVYAYNWGTASNNPEYQKSKLIAHRAANTHSDFDVIPTIGVGFCNIALNNSGTRTPNITNPDYENVLSWAKNTYLAGQNQSFAENLVILSNWNEVGEGHFIMPGTRNGFGYLDCIRKVFTSDTTHTDISPSESERSRFNSLFLQNRKKIRRLFNEENSDNVSNLVSSREWDFSVSSERQKWSRYYNLTSYVKTAQSIKGTSTKSDFCVYSDTIKTDSAKATTVRIRMKNDPATSMATSTAELYYITSADSEWNDSKRIVFAVTTDGAYHDYYINTRSKPLWNSDIIQIRIDAMTTPGTFEISNVALMYDPTICNVSVNNTDVTNKFDFSPERTPNGLMVSIDPLDGILSMLGAYHEWDSKNGVLTIYSNNHSITTSLGSALAVTDRGNVTMANEMYLRDGLPILCFDTIASALDFILEYDESNQVYNIYKNQSIKEESQDPYSYTFDTSGYMQNWSYTCATLLKQDNGALYFRAETNGRRYDPTFVSPDISIDAQKFKKVEITFRYSMTQASSSTATLFFRHKDDIFAATMCSQLIVPNASSNGFITYTFDMTDNESWNGTITQLRFDPFESSAGTFDIDSVRILE